MQLIAKYANISNSKAAVIYNSIILIACGFVFGISSFIYSVIIMVVSTIIIDKIDVGTPSNKTLTIYTTKGKKVQSYLKGLLMIQ